MTKFNARGSTPRVSGPISGSSTPAGRTYQGAPGYERDVKSELFLLATTNLVSEDTFYEDAKTRDGRYQELVRTMAVVDPVWTYGLLRWLRGPGNLRSAPIVGACEFVKARLDANGTKTTSSDVMNARRNDPNKVGLNRAVIDAVCQRPDEPAEIVAYWTSRYGRALPKPVKRGVADATERMASEKSLLKYDTESHAWRLGDVLELTHPRTKAPWQGELYKHAIYRRHNRVIDMIDLGKDTSLETIVANHQLKWAVEYGDGPEMLLDPDNVKAAGMTWQNVLSLVGDKVNKAKLWEALIPSMGYMALLRNLRNFSQAGISNVAADTVMQRIMDPDEVKRSRQLPMRFLSAYRAAGSDLRWSWPLECALNHSLGNIPQLTGQTLILVDTSGSMKAPLSARSDLKRWDAAAVFGIALGRRCVSADVVSFSDRQRNWLGYDRRNDRRGTGSSVVFPIRQDTSLLAAISRWEEGGYFLDGGTDTAAAVRTHLKPHHTRLVILTDEQSRTDINPYVPADVKLHVINVAGYRLGQTNTERNRWTYGGLSDNVFHVMMHVERGQDATWPWEAHSA
jgi:hypothetical protein